MKRIYVDCTFTFYSGVNTGIQRVVRNIIGRLDIVEREFGVRCVPVISVRGHFFEISKEAVLESRPMTASLGARVKFLFDRFKKRVLALSSASSLVHFFSKSFLAYLEFLLKKIFTLIKLIRVMKKVFEDGFKRIQPKKDDVIFLLDAFWIYDIQQLLNYGNHGAQYVVAVVYDLIPVNFPAFVEDEDGKHFNNALPRLIKLADLFICISRSVANELEDYVGKHFPELKSSKNFDYFHLGADFNLKPASSEISEVELRKEIENVFLGQVVWVVVGTLEPRKNHAYILNAFDRLWANGANDRLLIVGRIGWKCDDLTERINNHPLFGIKLYHFWDISDLELKYIYQKSEGLIFASFSEGFGLPIIEAMHGGIKVLCSDIPIFREVGGEYASYFNLTDPVALVNLIELERGKRTSPSLKKWISWEQSVLMLFNKILYETSGENSNKAASLGLRPDIQMGDE